MDTTKALSDYQCILQSLNQLEAAYATNVAKLRTTKHKIKQWLNENAAGIECPDWLIEDDPQLAWEIGERNDSAAISLHMLVDDVKLPQMEAAYEESVKPLKALKEDIEKWGLQQLLERKAKNFKSAEGTGSLRTDVKYQASDKKLFGSWLDKNDAWSEVSITIRPNSKYFAGVLENLSELPPGLSQFREQRCTFIKPK